MATRRPKIDLKPLVKLIKAKIKELQTLHDSGKLTLKQMLRVKLVHLPKLKHCLRVAEEICSDHPWHEHDPFFCPAPDSKGDLFGTVAASKRLLGRRKK